jgi:hypothetical protein
VVRKLLATATLARAEFVRLRVWLTTATLATTELVWLRIRLAAATLTIVFGLRMRLATATLVPRVHVATLTLAVIDFALPTVVASIAPGITLAVSWSPAVVGARP